MQYPVICAVCLHLNCCNSFSHYCAIVMEGSQKEEERRRKSEARQISRLATYQSGTLVMLPAKLTVQLLMETLNNV